MSIVAVHGPTMLGAGGGGPGAEPRPVDPRITSITPSSLPSTAPLTTITIRGFNFESTSVIEVGAAVRPTTFLNDNTITTTYDPTTPGTVMVTVRNVNDEESNDFPFVVTGAMGDDPEPDPQNPDPFHPNDHTIDEVKEYVEDLVGLDEWIIEETQRILDLERAFGNRTTLVAWLDARLGAT